MPRRRPKVRQFETICESLAPGIRVPRMNISASVSGQNEERLYALANFTPTGNASRIVDEALTCYFSRADVRRQLDGAYETWREAAANVRATKV